ncbi:MAG TPA: response regulator [Methylococcaceae bacterium]|nr:response regulator [Methylococcaceae bacterium]
MTTETEPTVFIVDDDENMRHSLSRLCKSVGLPAESYSGAQQFLQNCDPERHGCLVTDMRMPGISGLDLLPKLRAQGITLPVIVITGYGDVASAVRAMKSGAVEFLEKPFSNQELLDCIHKCMELDLRIKSKLQRRAQITGRFATLTAREREVMKMVVDGKTNKSIAIELAISGKTVEAHRFRLMVKMQAKTVVDLTRMYLELCADESREDSGEYSFV